MLTFVEEELEQYGTDLSDMKIATFEKEGGTFEFEMSKDDGTEITYSVTLTGKVKAVKSTVTVTKFGDSEETDKTESCEFEISDDGTNLTMTISSTDGLDFEKDGDVIAFSIFGTFRIKGSDGSEYTASTKGSIYMIQYGTEGGDGEQSENGNDDNDDTDQDTDWQSVESITIPDSLIGLTYCGVISGNVNYDKDAKYPCVCAIYSDHISMMQLDDGILTEYGGDLKNQIQDGDVLIVPTTESDNIYYKYSFYTDALARFTIDTLEEAKTESTYKLHIEAYTTEIRVTIEMSFTPAEAEINTYATNCGSTVSIFKVYGDNSAVTNLSNPKIVSTTDSEALDLDDVLEVKLMLGIDNHNNISLMEYIPYGTYGQCIAFAIFNLDRYKLTDNTYGRDVIDTEVCILMINYTDRMQIGKSETENVYDILYYSGYQATMTYAQLVVDRTDYRIDVAVQTYDNGSQTVTRYTVPMISESDWLEQYGS